MPGSDNAEPPRASPLLPDLRFKINNAKKVSNEKRNHTPL